MKQKYKKYGEILLYFSEFIVCLHIILSITKKKKRSTVVLVHVLLKFLR